jgi:pyruvate,water dikinase
VHARPCSEERAFSVEHGKLLRQIGSVQRSSQRGQPITFSTRENHDVGPLRVHDGGFRAVAAPTSSRAPDTRTRKCCVSTWTARKPGEIHPRSIGTYVAVRRDMSILWFKDVRKTDVAVVGGKNANLGELVHHLVPAGVRIPDGFALTADAFRAHLRAAGIEERIYAALDSLDPHDMSALSRIGEQIRTWVREAPLPAAIVAQLVAAYEQLSEIYGERATDVAVRSSATAEDLPDASFAGQQESYLDVRGADALVLAVRNCMASLFTDRAIIYRRERGFAHRAVALSVGIQKMVRSDLASAGVMFTLETESGCRDVVEINASWGLGETVVKGHVNPDDIVIHKATLARGYRPIVRREIGDKAVKLVYAEGAEATRLVDVVENDRRRCSISDDEALRLARWAIAIEAHFQTPMDIEWAKDGRSGEMFIVQARPETVHARRASRPLEIFHLAKAPTALVTGKSIGSAIATGPARIIRTREDLMTFRDGDVIVAPMTDPDWEPVLARATAVITDQGGRTCHAAIVSRELGIPCVIGTTNATEVLQTGDILTVSCAEGTEGHVYAGAVPFTKEQIDLAALPTSPVPVMLNVGNPLAAFQLSALPSAGVGLARIEFIISSQIGIHPMALVHPERISAADLAAIRTKAAGAASPKEYFIDGLARGVGQIAAAFYPRPVVVRFSDFKTNEYANLLGGVAFEPVENNPMIGFRGASRYYDPRYREGFALECEAMRRVHSEMGFSNVKLMIPFCRTLKEADRVLAELAAAGLRRGMHGLEIWVMCEIPNNVLLAREFASRFDGFSIGSNDLTQLILGVDRDSELLSHVFDEDDPGVKRAIKEVVRVAHECGRRVGLCGQAPSDRPAFAAFLASIDIDSISVTPDALPAVVRTLAKTTEAQTLQRPAPVGARSA